MSGRDNTYIDPYPLRKITAEQLEQMPVILTVRQYRALDEAMQLIETYAADPDDPDSVDFSGDPWLEQVHIRLSIAALSPWGNPINQPVLSQVGMCFRDTSEHRRLHRKINKHLAEMDRQEKQAERGDL